MVIADLGAVRVHYRVEGPAHGPTLALIHSLGTDLSMWDRVAESLADEFRVLRFDLRGHGNSSVPAGPYRLADFCQDLLALLDFLKLPRVHLAGTSLGGMIAMDCAIRAPQRAGKVVLANTAARVGTSEGWNARISEARARGMAQLAMGAAERWFTEAFLRANAAEAARCTAMLASCPVEGYIASCAALGDSDLSMELSRLVSPCLVIAGSSDPVTTPADGRALQAAIPDAHSLELPATHLSAVELPDRFSQAVRSFVNEETSHG